MLYDPVIPSLIKINISRGCSIAAEYLSQVEEYDHSPLALLPCLTFANRL
jgi:hypothetical protein